MKNKLATSIFFLALGIFIGYTLIPKSQKAESYKAPQQVEVKYEIPECFLGRCPKYESVDVDGDKLAESVIIIPTTMTRGAGKLWIIKNGKVIFKSGEYPGISFENTDEGFLINFISSFETGEESSVKYIYRNGKFTTSD